MRKAFTLIEMLLALTIAALTVTVIFSVYHITARILGDRDARVHGDAAAVRALELITADLSAAVPLEMYEVCAFSLIETDHPVPGSAMLSWCTAVRPSPDEEDLRWSEIHHVRYRLDTAGRDRPRLIRIHQPLAGPGALMPPVTNTLIEAVEQLEISVLKEEDWVTEWHAARAEDWPRAARIAIHTITRRGETRSFRTDILIPAGLELERASPHDAIRE